VSDVLVVCWRRSKLQRSDLHYVTYWYAHMVIRAVYQTESEGVVFFLRRGAVEAYQRFVIISLRRLQRDRLAELESCHVAVALYYFWRFCFVEVDPHSSWADGWNEDWPCTSHVCLFVCSLRRDDCGSADQFSIQTPYFLRAAAESCLLQRSSSSRGQTEPRPGSCSDVCIYTAVVIIISKYWAPIYKIL